MREIKFRAWDNGEKRMIIHSELMERDQEVMCIYTALTDEESLRVNKWIPLQYTGLKDKNGREIYEGDVVDDSYVSPLSGERVEKHYKVIYEKAGYNAHMIGSHPFGSTWLEFLSKKREVIGNIYENPELLEAQNE